VLGRTARYQATHYILKQSSRACDSFPQGSSSRTFITNRTSYCHVIVRSHTLSTNADSPLSPRSHLSTTPTGDPSHTRVHSIDIVVPAVSFTPDPSFSLACNTDKARGNECSGSSGSGVAACPIEVMLRFLVCYPHVSKTKARYSQPALSKKPAKAPKEPHPGSSPRQCTPARIYPTRGAPRALN